MIGIDILCRRRPGDRRKQRHDDHRIWATGKEGQMILRAARRARGVNLHDCGSSENFTVTANATSLASRQMDDCPIEAPRPMCSRVTTADGRSPGSRVFALCRLPGIAPSGFWQGLSAYSCGGSYRMGPKVRTVFPFNSKLETVADPCSAWPSPGQLGIHAGSAVVG